MIETLKNNSSDELISIILDKENLLIDKENTIVGQKSEIEYLKHQVNLFQKALFGQKKETHKSLGDTQQEKLPFEKVDLDLHQDVELSQITYHRKKANKKRTDYSKLELPQDMERVVTIIEPEDKTEDMVKIGEDVTEVLAITQQKFFVKKIIRPKYAKQNKEGVTIAPLPSRVIPGGKVDESLLVMLLLDKYVDHLPLYRQIKKYERLGMKLSDATVGDWTAKTINLLSFLYDRLVYHIQKCSYLQADETTMRVLDKLKKGATHLGYYWVYHSIEQKMVLFNYHPGRDQSAPKDFLQDFSGVLQTDGYAAYDAVIKKNTNITLAGCMAHARRYFFDAQDNKKEMCTWMLDKIQQLYAIEAMARDGNYSYEKRLRLREEKSVPVLNEMKQWLDSNLSETPKSPIAKAINYMKVRWNKLILFASDGRLEIDNNLVENAIRPVALGRKNYLFAGSHQAAQRGAIIYSLIATCKLNAIDPYTWLTDVLQKLPDTKSSDLDSLLPKAILERDGA